jgi:hypothetical protein
VAGAKSSTTGQAAGAAGVVVFVALAVCWFVWRGRPPQMAADEEVFKTVDALFTAVTARDEKLLGQCEQRLQALRDAGKLPGDASDYLGGVIRKARDGRWQSAAEKLYGFMKAQRREGTRDHPKKEEKARPTSGRK